MNREHSLLITEYLPGTIAEGTPSQFDRDVHRQAGFILRQLHDLAAIQDPDYEEQQTVKALGWLEKPHRIASETTILLHKRLRRYQPQPVVVVPSHGDWHARNWLMDRGKVRAIDFGRYDFRPALYDLWRLARREWQGRPNLEHAFLDGYGHDPREPNLWQIILLREAISTAVWAFAVGDERFEQQGHAMIADSLATWIE
jgi:Ser/Thr protein kinase RdoA (MazF antagonist)